MEKKGKLSFWLFLSVIAYCSAWTSLSSSAPEPGSPKDAEVQLSRRALVKAGLLVPSLVISRPAFSMDSKEKIVEESGMMSAQAVGDLLHSVPTFTIVDKKGVPFMVVGEDAKVTGYFFTSYGEADRILKLASSSAAKSIAQAKAEGKSAEEIGENPWKKARISSVPLDSAATLVRKSTASFGGGNYFRIAPSEADIDDALALTGQTDLAEGKVPLFYYDNFTIDIEGEQRSPLYFKKSELEAKYKASNPGSPPPQVLVTELFAVLAEMVRPGNKDEDLKKLAFIPPRDSEQKKKACEKAGGKEPAFFIGQRIIVL